MCKRINQNIKNGKIRTFTTGTPQGTLPNFDVSITSGESPRSHRRTELKLDFMNDNGKRSRFTLNGRNARTLYEVLSRHFSEFDYR